MVRGSKSFVLSLVSMGLVISAAQSDCGSIPFRSPMDLWGQVLMQAAPNGGKDVQFDPMDVVVYEPGQKGIILWNGQEEILLLSTDIRTSQPSYLLEVIPMPSEPQVELGDFATFQKMQRLLIDKTMWRVASGGGVPGAEAPASAAQVTFHQQMGAHDVTVVNVLDQERFVDWVNVYFVEKKAENPKIDPKFAQVIRNYLDRGMQWFVFDSLRVDESLQSKQPVAYRFKTGSVYYPLEISSRETGKTLVDLVIVTPTPLGKLPKYQFAARRESDTQITAAELRTVHEGWPEFMGAESFALQRVRLSGRLEKMTVDFIVR